MRTSLIISIFFIAILSSKSQDRILYDLDSYKRVDVNFRTSYFSPDFSLNYDNTINNTSIDKRYTFNLGGYYSDNHILNSENNQETKYQSLSSRFNSGTSKSVDLTYVYRKEKRHYAGARYFKNGINIITNMDYSENASSFKRFSQLIDVKYDLGFGFGRLEVVNYAWLGARILEELDSKNLLNSIPSADEMKLFFNLIDDVKSYRVMDFRLSDMYRVEKIIEFIEGKEWIDKGDIKAFIVIYDAYRYENFITRMSGERLEFTLSPTLLGTYSWRNTSIFYGGKYIQPGFIGSVEYELHRNGDLEYYQTKIFGGRITHYQRFVKEQEEDSKTISGDLYFQYEYHYIPSLRTNLSFSANFSGGFVYSNSYDAIIAVNTSITYNYYFSPSTQMVIKGGIFYDDSRFQIGSYQPEISTFMSFDIRHAIR
jgi:hypothetical protein